MREANQVVGKVEMDRIPMILSRLDRVEQQVNDLNDLWRKTTDDIKNTIRGEISQLKAEQIADHKTQLATLESRVRVTEDRIRDWDTGRGILRWIIHVIVGLVSGLGGFLGAKHLG